MLATRELTVAIESSILVSGCIINCLVIPTLFKISSFVFNRRKKLIQVWNNSIKNYFLGELSL